MKKKLKLILTIIAAALILPSLALAIPSSVDRITDHIEPLLKSDFIKGNYFVATSTTATSTGANGWDLSGGCFAIGGTCIGSGPTLPVSLTNGGWGQSMIQTDVAVSGTVTVNNQAVATGFLRFTGTATLTLTGLVSDATSKRVLILNNTTNPITIPTQSGFSTAANRIVTPDGASVLIPTQSSLELVYNTVTSRWNFGVVFNTVTAPLVKSDAGTISIPQGTGSVNGFISATDWTTFNNKVSNGGGAANRNAFWISGTTISYNDDNTWDNVNHRLGLGMTNPSYRADVVSSSDTVSEPNTVSTNYVLESKDPAPTPVSVTLIYGPFPVTSGSGVEGTYTGGTGYTNNDSVQAFIYPYKIINGTKYTSNTGFDLGTINIASNPGEIDWSWVASMTGDGGAPDGYIIQIVDSTISTTNTIDLGNTTFYADSNEFGSESIQPIGGFSASGQTFTYDAYSIATSPGGGTYYSDPNNFTANDVYNNGSPIVPYLQFTASGSDDQKFVDNLNGNALVVPSATTDYYQFSVFGDSPTVTPQHYGILSDGTALNRDYELYGYSNLFSIYSSTAVTTNNIDPNDGQYYYIATSYTQPDGTGIKIRRNINSAGFATGQIYNGTGALIAYEDALAPAFSDGITVTPTVSTATAGRFTNGSTDTNPVAALIINSDDGSAPRAQLDFNKGSTNNGRIYTGSNNHLNLYSSADQINFVSSSSNGPALSFITNAGTVKAGFNSDGQLGVARNGSASTANLAIGAGASGVTQILLDSTATLPSSPKNGGIEYNGNFFGSDSSTRRAFVRTASATLLTSGTIPVAGSGGFLSDSALSISGGVLTVGSTLTALFQGGISLGSGKNLTMGSGSAIIGGLRTAIATAAVSTSLSVVNHSPYFEFTGSTAGRTLTLPTAASISGTEFNIYNRASVSVTLTTTSSQNINYGNTAVTSIVLQPGDAIGVVANASSEWDAFSYDPFIYDGSKLAIGTTTPWGQISASSTSAFPTLAIEQKGAGPAAIFLGGNIGIGTTSPFARLSILTGNATTWPLAIATTTGVTVAGVDNVGHIRTGGYTPAVSSCGVTPAITGNDVSGTVTVGTGIITACTVTFSAAFTNTPKIFVQTEGGTAIASSISARSTTAFTVTFAASLGAGVFDYWIVD